ncbi:hypothetical protein JHFBIEKO_2049 [Methylobacterium mesophilicum]|uniref:hypothetical protein n=1 Tax=Methylobacterium TaxID=407 RepID=UPI0011CC51B1|nr:MULTISPECIES: hypothetical protein [Methylobacterium]TXN45564.1 hypothetical protein FV233_10850 [Methylobacterium sp. WL7]GJE21605.1 hypothetical protein JHFBIEKO_2049 [Methylobacterium mesophilicum]
MPAYPSLSRILAAGSGLGGLGYMMTQPDPSVEDVMTGLSCLVLCVGFSAMPAPKTPKHRAPVPPPPAPEARPIPLLPGPQPHRLLMTKIVQPASELPELGSQRQRRDDRQPKPIS